MFPLCAGGLPLPGPACLLALHDMGRTLLSSAHTLALSTTVLARLLPGWPVHQAGVISAFLGMAALKSAIVLAHAVLTTGDSSIGVTSPQPPPLLLTGLEAGETVGHVVLFALLIGHFVSEREVIVQPESPGSTRFVHQKI